MHRFRGVERRCLLANTDIRTGRRLSLYEVAQVLGHTDVQTTQRYAHLEARTTSEKARNIMERLIGAQ